MMTPLPSLPLDPLLLLALLIPTLLIYTRLRSLPEHYGLWHVSLHRSSSSSATTTGRRQRGAATRIEEAGGDGLPRSLWLNCGLWGRGGEEGEEGEGEYERACERLFRGLMEMLRAVSSTSAADLGKKINKKSTNTLPPPLRVDTVFEVGPGCGDSIRWLFDAEKGRKVVDVKRYIGIEGSKTQLEVLKGRYSHFKGVEVYGCDTRRNGVAGWEKGSKESVLAAREKKEGEGEKVLVAVESLYHVDRRELLRRLPEGWTLAAVDFVRGDGCTGLTRIVLWGALRMFMGFGLGNILTREEYAKMLVGCGWDEVEIRIVDRSGEMFPGYSEFLKRQKVPRWKILGKLVEYWSERDAIRGVFIVARNKR